MLKNVMKKYPLFYSFIAVGLMMFGLVFVPCNTNIVYRYIEGNISEVPNSVAGYLTILGFLLSVTYAYINKPLRSKGIHYVLAILLLVLFPMYELFIIENLSQSNPTFFHAFIKLVIQAFAPIIVVSFFVPGFLLNSLFKEFSILLPFFIIIPFFIGISMLIPYISYTRSLYSKPLDKQKKPRH